MKTCLTMLIVLTFAGHSLAQMSARDASAIAEHRARAREAEMLLAELGAVDIINKEGVAMPLTAKDTAEEIRAVVAGSQNYQPWVTVGSLKAGTIGRLKAQSTNHSEHAIVVVDQVLNGDEFIGICGRDGIWVSGFKTVNLHDDSKLIMDKVVEVMGSKTYDTVGGSTKTVTHVKVCDRDDIVKLQTEFTTNPPQKSSNHYRIWRGKKGSSLVAKIKSFGKGEVSFEDRSGSVTTVDLKELDSKSKKAALALRKTVNK